MGGGKGKQDDGNKSRSQPLESGLKQHGRPARFRKSGRQKQEPERNEDESIWHIHQRQGLARCHLPMPDAEDVNRQNRRCPQKQSDADGDILSTGSKSGTAKKQSSCNNHRDTHHLALAGQTA